MVQTFYDFDVGGESSEINCSGIQPRFFDFPSLTFRCWDNASRNSQDTSDHMRAVFILDALVAVGILGT